MVLFTDSKSKTLGNTSEPQRQITEAKLNFFTAGEVLFLTTKNNYLSGNDA